MKPTHLLAASLFTALILACLAAPAAAFSGGSGTEADPYIISTAEDWNSITPSNTYYYALANDISSSNLNTLTNFKGHIDGRGFTLDFNNK